VRQVVPGDLADGQVEVLLALLAVDAEPPAAVVADPKPAPSPATTTSVAAQAS